MPDPLLASLPWLHIPMVLWSQLMSQQLLLPVLTTWPPRVLPSTLPSHLAPDQLDPLPQLVQLPMHWAMLVPPLHLLVPSDMLDPLLASPPWLHIPMVLWSQLMSQRLLLPVLTTWLLRVLPSMLPSHLAPGQLDPLPQLVQLPVLWAMLALPLPQLVP